MKKMNQKKLIIKSEMKFRKYKNNIKNKIRKDIKIDLKDKNRDNLMIIK
jgi:hypothetical protein